MILLSILVIAIVWCMVYLTGIVEDPVFKQAIVIIGLLLAFVTFMFEPWEIKVVSMSLPLVLGYALKVV